MTAIHFIYHTTTFILLVIALHVCAANLAEMKRVMMKTRGRWTFSKYFLVSKWPTRAIPIVSVNNHCWAPMNSNHDAANSIL